MIQMGNRFPVFCLITVMAVMIWSWINPHDRFTWWLESVPAIFAIIILVLSYQRFRLTNLLYGLIALHAIILLVGAHYTYAKVPLFDDLQNLFGWQRNHYDRVGHLAQGFVPALIARELLLRTSSLRAGKWMFVLIILGCLGISALYEIIEWVVADLTGEAAESFLGTQGDVWDTQKDMALAGLGAVLGLLSLCKWHDAQLKKLKGTIKI
jgi:putative membrane protein